MKKLRPEEMWWMNEQIRSGKVAPLDLSGCGSNLGLVFGLLLALWIGAAVLLSAFGLAANIAGILAAVIRPERYDLVDVEATFTSHTRRHQSLDIQVLDFGTWSAGEFDTIIQEHPWPGIDLGVKFTNRSRSRIAPEDPAGFGVEARFTLDNCERRPKRRMESVDGWNYREDRRISELESEEWAIWSGPMGDPRRGLSAIRLALPPGESVEHNPGQDRWESMAYHDNLTDWDGCELELKQVRVVFHRFSQHLTERVYDPVEAKVVIIENELQASDEKELP